MYIRSRDTNICAYREVSRDSNEFCVNYYQTEL